MERELYDDALKCAELVTRLGGRPYHSETTIKDIGKKIAGIN
jgi:hypothetical protein